MLLSPRCLVTALLLITVSVLTTRAQNVNTTRFTVAGPGNGAATGQLFPTAGGWLVAGQIRFSNDSNCISVLRLSPALNITRSRQYKVTGAGAFAPNYGPFLQTSRGLVFQG